jgi:hypothetical protein
MKQCPKCKIDYFDNSLEFCLEDGMKLSFVTNFDNEISTLFSPNRSNLTSAETVDLPNPNLAAEAKYPFANARQ